MEYSGQSLQTDGHGQPREADIECFHEDASKPKGCGQEGAFVSLFIKTVNLLDLRR